MFSLTATPVDSLQLLTLGSTELRRGRRHGGWDVLPVTGKPLALLIRLAASGDHPISRDVLAEELWSDIDRDRAKAQFRTALWALKKHVPTELIRADDSTIALTGAIRSDRAEFQAAVRTRDFGTAVNLYRGDFLAHFAVSAAAGFEEWADVERRNLRGLFIATAEAYARQLSALGRFSQAAEFAVRARDAEPLGQGAWRALLEALVSGGDAVRARAEAASLLTLQADEAFDLEPETRRLIQLATCAAPGGAARHADAALEAELVGRERDLAGLLALVDAADRQQAAIATVIGPPGIGKTRLLRDFARSVAARRGRVVVVEGARATERVPYATIARVAEQLAMLPGALGVSAESAVALVGLHPALSGVFPNATATRMPHDHRFRMLAVGELARAVADEARLTIIVDDAQWLDEQSRQVIESLPTVCAGSPLLVVLGERPMRETPATEANRFVLAPLTQSLTEAMVASMAALPEGGWTADWLRALHATSAGVPLAVLDVVRLGIERGLIRIEDRAWHCEQPAALIGLTEEAAPRRARIAQLPLESRELAIVLGVARGPLDALTAAGVLGVSGEQLESATDTLAQRGIGRLDGESVSLDHEEYGAAARDLPEPGARARIAVALAERLAARTDIVQIRRAYWLADEAGAADLSERIVRKYLDLARSKRPDFDARSALADLIGIGERAARLAELASRFDLRSRWRRQAVAAAIVVLAVTVTVLAIALGTREVVLPDAALSVEFVDHTGLIAVAEVPLRLSDWVSGRPVSVAASAATPLYTAGVRALSRSPTDPYAWLGVVAAGDSLTDEIAVVRRGAVIRTLASAANDDVAPSWSPDGRSAVFVTARWNGDRADLAIVDIATDAVTRLGGGPGIVNMPAFSGDGAGIVFTRTRRDYSAPEICVLKITSRKVRCRAIDGTEFSTTPSWPAARTVYFAAARRGIGHMVEAWDLQSDSVRVVVVCPGGMPRQQALGLFVVCATREHSGQLMVAPMAHPDQWRTIDVRGSSLVAAGGISVTDVGARRNAALGVRIRGAADAMINVEHTLRADIILGDSAVTEAEDATWTVVAGPASISPTGELFATAPGLVTVRAATGRSADTMHIRVRPRDDSLLFEERWTNSWRGRWRSFGVPAPQVVGAGQDAAFWNAGDGTYFSGAYSRESWDTRGGLVADLELSTPLTALKEQLMRAGFRGGFDDAAFARWDHQTGYPPGTPAEFGCSMDYPVGQASNNLIGTGGPAMTAPTAIRRGDRFRLRVQIFPDGRCGIAINGKAVAVESGFHARPRVRLYFDGASVGTKMLVYGVRLRRGVPGDIDWGRGNQKR